VKCGLVGDSELVRSHGQGAPLLEPVDGATKTSGQLDCVSGLHLCRANQHAAGAREKGRQIGLNPTTMHSDVPAAAAQ
jgi:hypothetical protein